MKPQPNQAAQNRRGPKPDQNSQRSIYENARKVVGEILGRRQVSGSFTRVKKKGIKFEQERNSVLAHITRSVKAAQAAIDNPQSVIDAMFECASIGLTLYPQLNYAYLTPQFSGGRNGITLVVGYRGMEYLAKKSGTVKQITTELVYSNDTFRRGMNRDGSTYVEFEQARGERGDLEGGFCRAILANDTMHIEWMSVDEIDGCEAAATAKQNGTPASWTGAFRGEMQKKCIVRRAAKHWIMDEDFVRLLDLMDKLDPMEFNRPEDEEEKHVDPITEKHKAAIVEKLAEWGVDGYKAAGWIERQCEALGFPNGSLGCPDAQWELVRDKLIARAENMKKAMAALGQPAGVTT